MARQVLVLVLYAVVVVALTIWRDRLDSSRGRKHKARSGGGTSAAGRRRFPGHRSHRTS